ncbi:MAG: DUF3667 domain-containing protein [Myxococcota bacterium]
MDEPNSHCLNCGTPLTGPYCPECGQKDFGTRVDLWELAGEFVSETFELEGRLPRTLFSVLFKPGEFLYRYLEGQRRSFVSPLRFYLLAAFLCVVVTSWRVQSAALHAVENGSVSIVQKDGGLFFDVGDNVRERRRAEREAKDRRALYLAVSDRGDVSDEAEQGLPFWDPMCAPVSYDWVDSMYEDPSLQSLCDADGWDGLAVKLSRMTLGRSDFEITVMVVTMSLEQLPLALSAMMAVFALLLKLFWWRQPATVHVLVTVTFHALVLYGVTVWMLFPTAWMLWLVHGWLQTHALFSLKAAYGSPWPRTFASYFALGLAWCVLAFAGLILALLAGVWLSDL